MFEDLFNGVVIHVGDLTGFINAEAYEGKLYLYMTVPEFGNNDAEYYPEDFRILKMNNEELIIELPPYTYSDIRKSDCEPQGYVATHKGATPIYGTYIDDYYTYLYFKPGGTAVEVYYEDSFGNPYYYDTTRIYCRKR